MRRPGEGTTPAGTWGDWLAPAEAWRRVHDVWQPALVGQESVPLAGVRGRVLAQDVQAPSDLPAFDRSAMDGYAVRAADTAAAAEGGPVRRAHAGDVPMGAPGAPAGGPGEGARAAPGPGVPPAAA